MKIALVSSSFLPQVGGAEIVVHNLAVQWARQGHEVSVLNGITDKTTHPEANYGVVKFKIPRGSTRFGYHRFPFSQMTEYSLKKCLERFKPDAISAHFGYPVGFWMGQIKPLPNYTITCHGDDITPFYWGDITIRKCEKQLFQGLHHSACVVAISRYCQQWMLQKGIPASKIAYIPNGVDTGRFQKEVSFDLRRHFHLPQDAQVVLSVGREHPQKDFKTGIKAFFQISKKYPRSFYIILGKGVSQNQALTKELGISDNVILSEGLYGDDLVGAYQQADVLFSPSIWELHSLVVMEALAAGLPCVVTNISGSPDVIEKGVNGYIVEPSDPQSMAEAMMILLSNPQMRKTMRQNNLLKSKQYDWDSISRKYLKVMV